MRKYIIWSLSTFRTKWFRSSRIWSCLICIPFDFKSLWVYVDSQWHYVDFFIYFFIIDFSICRRKNSRISGWKGVFSLLCSRAAIVRAGRRLFRERFVLLAGKPFPTDAVIILWAIKYLARGRSRTRINKSVSTIMRSDTPYDSIALRPADRFHNFSIVPKG